MESSQKLARGEEGVGEGFVRLQNALKPATQNLNLKPTE